ncbi:hypothetical protein ACFL1B_00990 [Nanoarchaeota archaeon]
MAKKDNPIGALIFLIALVLAVLLGALNKVDMTIATILVIAGLIVGLLNVTGKETKDFLIAGAVLVIVSAYGAGEMSIMPEILDGIFQGLLLVFIPATAVVALKEMLMLARR